MLERDFIRVANEHGDSIVSFVIALPIVLLFALMLIDLGQFTSQKAMLSKACNRGATVGTAAKPLLAAGATPIQANIRINLQPEFKTNDPNEEAPGPMMQADEFYTSWKGEWCGQVCVGNAGQAAPCTCDGNTAFSQPELFSMAAATQYIQEADKDFVLPKQAIDPTKPHYCPEGKTCGYVVPESFPNTEKERTLVLRCSMSVNLFSTPILNLFSGGTAGHRTQIDVVSIRSF